MTGEINAGLVDLNSFYRGADQANALMQRFATRKAGALMASGNTKGAIGTLQTSGQLGDADALQKSQDQIKKDDLANQQIAESNQQARYTHHATMMGDIATSLDNVGTQLGWDKVGPAFEHLAPIFAHNGVDPGELQQVRDAIAKDPQGTIRAISRNSAEHLKRVTVKPGDISARDDGTGVIANRSPKYQILPAGSSLVEEPQGQQDGQVPQQVPGQTLQDQPPAEVAPPSGDPAQTPVNFNALKQVESGNNPDAVSFKGGPDAASGAAQTKPSTRRDPGYGVKPAQDDSPQEADRVGKDYLGAMTAKFGHPIMGLIAYNWGPGKTQRWKDAGADFNKLPKETQLYIGKVALAQARDQEPELGDFALDQPASNAPAKATTGPKVVIKGEPVWRPLNDAEQKQYPGAIQINNLGAVKYPPASAAPVTMTDDGKKLAAHRYLLTGQLPPLGMGGMSLRQELISMAADEAKQMGQSGSGVLAAGSEFKSNAAALTKMTTSRAQVAAFEGTVSQSMGLVKQYAKPALANSGFTFTNRASNWWKTATNDVAMGRLNNAIQTTTNEYAKVISNATGGGVTSDAARAHAEELLNNADSYESLMAKMDTLQQEMDFRVGNMDKQIGDLGAKLRDPFGQKANKSGHFNPATKKIEWH